MQPRADRPRIPREYGTSTRAKGLLDWEFVEQRLTDARVYWVATSGPGGRPRVRPVDGIYLEGTIYVGGSPKTRWVRDLMNNGQVSVHLDGPDVVIVEGEAELLDRVPRETAERVAAASNAKYPEYKMTPESYSGPGPWAIRPHKVWPGRTSPGIPRASGFTADPGSDAGCEASRVGAWPRRQPVYP